MASNSDTIYYLLTKLKAHPELILSQGLFSSNSLVLSFSDAFKVANSDYYFPDNHLMVNRLSPGFVAKNGELLDYFFQQTQKQYPVYRDVWVTTSHDTRMGQYLIDLSFE